MFITIPIVMREMETVLFQHPSVLRGAQSKIWGTDVSSSQRHSIEIKVRNAVVNPERISRTRRKGTIEHFLTLADTETTGT